MLRSGVKSKALLAFHIALKTNERTGLVTQKSRTCKQVKKKSLLSQKAKNKGKPSSVLEKTAASRPPIGPGTQRPSQPKNKEQAGDTVCGMEIPTS